MGMSAPLMLRKNARSSSSSSTEQRKTPSGTSARRRAMCRPPSFKLAAAFSESLPDDGGGLIGLPTECPSQRNVLGSTNACPSRPREGNRARPVGSALGGRDEFEAARRFH